MIFTAVRGEAFKEEFTFKSASGKLATVPNGEWSLCLERDSFVQEFTNLRITRNTIYWNMTAEQTKELPYPTMYFTLNFKGVEIARGVLRVN